MTSQPELDSPHAPRTSLTDDLRALTDGAPVAGLQIIVKQETPFLPKVAFVLITLASLGGVAFTGTLAGLGWLGIAGKWLPTWSMALVGGLVVWRAIYLRPQEPGTDPARVAALNAEALTRATTVGRWLAPLVALSAAGPFVVGYLDHAPAVRWTLVATLLLAAVGLALGVSSLRVAVGLCALVGVGILAWSFADTGGDWESWQLWVRVLHLTAFTLWLGGALWNIGVAMPTGRHHANVDAVLAGARQLDRFRWVVRFVLPTIIVTGLLMAGLYRALPLAWWTTFPGVLVPLKVLAIVALVVVFLLCPLFRHCSPVQGVCNIDDLDEGKP